MYKKVLLPTLIDIPGPLDNDVDDRRKKFLQLLFYGHVKVGQLLHNRKQQKSDLFISQGDYTSLNFYIKTDVQKLTTNSPQSTCKSINVNVNEWLTQV